VSERRLLHAATWGQVFAAEPNDGPPVWVVELAANDDVDAALHLCAGWLDVRHPGFAPLVEASVEPHAGGRVLRVVHESPRGIALAELVAQSPPLVEHAVALLLYDLGRGLALAHEQGLVAGNVAPSQLALCPPGLDDACAVQLHQPGLPLLCATVGGAPGDALRPLLEAPPTLAVGMPAAVAPEVLGGQTPQAAADVYGLCATAAYCLLGRSPFAAADAGLVRQWALRGLDAADLQALLRTAPTLGPLVARGLSAQPWARAGVLTEWLDACEKLLAGRSPKLVRGIALVPPWSLGSPLVPLAAWAHARWWTALGPTRASPTQAPPVDDQQAKLRAALQRLDLERLAARKRQGEAPSTWRSYLWVIVLFALVAAAIVVLGNRQSQRFEQALRAADRADRPAPAPLPKPRPRPPEVIFETQPDR
jgi:hypothetical protein